jgi:hypothetical protein
LALDSVSSEYTLSVRIYLIFRVMVCLSLFTHYFLDIAQPHNSLTVMLLFSARTFAVPACVNTRLH